MPRRAARPIAVALALLAAPPGCGRDRPGAAGSSPPSAATATAAPAPLRLVVLLVVDQLPSWSFERDRPALSGGIARLLRHGVYFSAAELPYANTYTATGHAALVTGATPRTSGIIGNRWYDRAAGASVDATTDPASPVLAVVPGRAPGPGQSSHRLLVPGISDALEAATATRGRTVAVALKSRSAILATGQRADLAVWYDESQPAMTTSAAYVAAPPPWLVAFARERPIAPRLAATWEPSDPALVARLAGNPDDAPGEGPSEGGLDHTFPHRPADAAEPAEALLATPMATDLVFDVAEAAVAGERLGADDVPDFLAVSVSSHDYAGHAWGQDSWERVDLMLRLDRRIGAFLASLDRAVGADRYAVVFTADHGGVPLIEQSRAAGRAAFRVQSAAVVEAAERGAARVLGRGRWIADYSYNSIYVGAAVRARPPAQRDAALAAIAAEVAKLPGMGLVAPTARLLGACHGADLGERLACESIAPDRSGEVYAVVADGSVYSGGPTTGSGHGSASAFDRVVPVIVVAPGLAPRRVDAPRSLLRVAPTLAKLLGVAAPSAATEPPLDLEAAP